MIMNDKINVTDMGKFEFYLFPSRHSYYLQQSRSENSTTDFNLVREWLAIL